jgi:hypothetical protein
MVRTMFDSVTATSIPPDVQMVAGYIDSQYAWSPRDWDRFTRATKVRIAVFPTTNDGHVLDVEPGNAGPTDRSVGTWIERRRDNGQEPTLYLPLSWWDTMRQSLDRWRIPHPQWWIAHWNGQPVMIPGTVAKQYADPSRSGGHYDLSVVADHWPGVDKVVDVLKPDERATLMRMGEILEVLNSGTTEQVDLSDIGAYFREVYDRLRSMHASQFLPWREGAPGGDLSWADDRTDAVKQAITDAVASIPPPGGTIDYERLVAAQVASPDYMRKLGEAVAAAQDRSARDGDPQTGPVT